jgi:hypothetical protein
MTTLIRTVLWALKGATEMERRIVDNIDLDIRRLVVITFWVSTAD